MMQHEDRPWWVPAAAAENAMTRRADTWPRHKATDRRRRGARRAKARERARARARARRQLGRAA